MSIPERPREPLDYPHFLVRLKFLIGAGAVVVLVCLGQLANITLRLGDQYATMAERSMTRDDLIEAPRGVILDRHGTVLASNRLAHQVVFSRVGLSRAEMRETVERLRPWFPETMAEWSALLDERRYLPRSHILTERPVSLNEVAPIIEQLAELPGITVREMFERSYPERGGNLGNLLGFMGHVNQRNMRSLLRRWGEDTSEVDWDALSGINAFRRFLSVHGYTPEDRVGVQGLEYTAERDLRGIKGRRRSLQDVGGVQHDSLIVEEAMPGDTVQLTLDLDLQRRAVELMGENSGVIVLMDLPSGAVRVLMTNPGFESDQLSTQWSALRNDSRQPLLNRAISEVYNPGSVMKPIVAMGALRDGEIDIDTRFYCDGTFELGNTMFRCDWRWGCEWQDVRGALRRSCNVFFYNTMHSRRGTRLGQDGWLEACRECGLFQSTGIELTGETLGHPPNRTLYPGEVIQLGIGQGPFDVTPLQMIAAYGRIAVDSPNFHPHLIDRITDHRGQTVWEWTAPPSSGEALIPGLTAEERQVVLDGMADVTRHTEGTGNRIGFPEEWRVAGKTGTAQNRGRIDAWFIGFAPWDDPQVVVGCVVEGGGHGADAAGPIVRDMLAAHFESEGMFQTYEASSSTTD